MIGRVVRIAVAVLLCAALWLPPCAALAGDEPNQDSRWADLQLELAYGGPLLALNAEQAPDPRFWYIDDEQIRQTMENDEELKRLFHLAYEAKTWRRSTGNWLFAGGAAALAVGLGVGLTSTALNIPDGTAQIVLVGGSIVGVGLIAPGIVLRVRTSRAEHDYLDYVRDKYGVTPNIRNRDPQRDELIRFSLLSVRLP